MLVNNSLVLYKNAAAAITGECVSGKFPVRFRTAPATQTKSAVYGTQSVRNKDFLVLSETPVSSLENALSFADTNAPSADDMYDAQPKNAVRQIGRASCRERV